jgi:hypothetical protein
VSARRLLWLAPLALLLACPADRAAAQDMPVPAAQQYELFTNILSFDRNLAGRTPGELVIGIVYQPRYHASRLAADEFAEAFRDSRVKEVAGFRISVEAIPLDSTAGLAESLERHGVDVAYLTPIRAADIRQVLETTRQAGVMTITGVPAYVRAGAAVGLDVRDGKPRILINLPRARAEGADFKAALLGLAEVTR